MRARERLLVVPNKFNGPVKSAYVKGYAAFINGKSLDTCPYQRGKYSRLSNRYAKAWENGYQDAKQDKIDESNHSGI